MYAAFAWYFVVGAPKPPVIFLKPSGKCTCTRSFEGQHRLKHSMLHCEKSQTASSWLPCDNQCSLFTTYRWVMLNTTGIELLAPHSSVGVCTIYSLNIKDDLKLFSDISAMYTLLFLVRCLGPYICLVIRWKMQSSWGTNLVDLRCSVVVFLFKTWIVLITKRKPSHDLFLR